MRAYYRSFRVHPSLLILILLLGFPWPVLAQASGQSPEEQLRARVNSYWTAWSKNEKDSVDQMVLEDDRQAFAKIPRFHLLDFKILSIKMAPDQKSAVVETRIKRLFPMRVAAVDWVLENQWIYEKDNWYLHYVQPQESTLFKGSGGRVFNQQNLPPAVPTPVVFEQTSHDFGNVPAGTVLQYEFIFENRGKEPARVTRVVISCPESLPKNQCVQARSNGSVFFPGAKGKVIAEWPDVSKPQKVDQTIDVEFDNGQVFHLQFVAAITKSKKGSR
ncbi:MAG: DUF1573 domain-containing protein [Terriglobia bacterium]